MSDEKICLSCVLPVCDDRLKACAFHQIKPRVVTAERKQERIEKRKAHDRLMYERNKEKRLEQMKVYYQLNQDKILSDVRRYQVANPERRKVWNSRYKQKTAERSGSETYEKQF